MENVVLNALVPPDLGRVQRIRRRMLAVLIVLLLPVLAVTGSSWADGSLADTYIEFAGLLLIFTCVLGRAFCTLYIGGRKSTQLVTLGPYSLCRNPLYFFSGLGTLGAGLSTGSVLVGLTLTAIYVAVFDSVIRCEESFLAATFGDDYHRYCERTPRWWPRLSAWVGVEELTVKPRALFCTLRDASWFLLVLPLSELLEVLQQTHVLPVWLHMV